MPGPPGGVLDLGALAAVEGRLRGLATAAVDHTVATGARSPRGAEADRAMSTAAATIATALWFDTLRVEDRVSVTPHAGPLLGAVHQVLRAAVDGDDDAVPSQLAADGGAAGPLSPAPGTLTGRRAPRATGAGNVGPNGTIWSALAGRFAAERFDRLPRGRQICLIDFAELRDSAIWEAVADERVSHLGELFWIVLVTGGTPGNVDAARGGGASERLTGAADGPADGRRPGGVGSPARAARLFEAAGWQVLTLRYGRRIEALFRAPGGAALRSRLDSMAPAELLSLLHLNGSELRRRLAGPGAVGVGVSRLLDALSDDEIHAALRDLGGHDLPLIIDAFDEVAVDRPTVLFAYTGPLPDPAGRSGSPPVRGPADRPDADTNAADTSAAAAPPGPAADITVEGSTSSTVLAPGTAHHAVSPADTGAAASTYALVVARTTTAPPATLPAGSSAERLARHVAAYLDRAPLSLAAPARVPTDTGGPPTGFRSTQEIFGATLRELPSLAPEVAAAVVTVSTRDADRVLAGWIDAASDRPAPATATPARRDVDASGADSPGSTGGGRHVAGGLSANAFGGVLASLGVAWSRLGLPLLPIGVADELAIPQVLPGWASGGAADGRSLLAVADTGVDPTRPGGWRHGLVGVPGITCWEPAFAQDAVWCLLEALARLGRVDGASSLIRLSARPVDQRLAVYPSDPASWWRHRSAVLAGGYRLRAGEPSAPLTLVGMGAVMPEVLRAADELSAGLRREIGVVCVTSPDLLFDALQARRGLAVADDTILTELFPDSRRGPLLTVVDGDPRTLGFLAGVHGAHITTLGSAAPVTPAAPGSGTGPSQAASRVPVEIATIVGAALDLIDEAGTG